MHSAVVTLSSKFQMVLPKDIREALSLKAGKKIVMVEKDGYVHLFPYKDIRKMKGSLPGLDAEGIRDHEDRI